MRIIGWTDAAHYVDLSSLGHTGYCITVQDQNSGVIIAVSKKQTIVSLSTTESEVIAAVEATKEIIFQRNILDELGFPQVEPTILYADNASMIALANATLGNYKRVKHFTAKINFYLNL